MLRCFRWQDGKARDWVSVVEEGPEREIDVALRKQMELQRLIDDRARGYADAARAFFWTAGICFGAFTVAMLLLSLILILGTNGVVGGLMRLLVAALGLISLVFLFPAFTCLARWLGAMRRMRKQPPASMELDC